ncbi:MAG: CCA tRNA nucleotidyltransferase [Elusimicrobiaceae bacterium]|nr:CCA tRNA nucleotidyltransferase [Elusimicrobiaceae bacterium]
MTDLAGLLRTIVPDAYYVGGCVRDSLLKKSSGDIDLALPANRVKPAALALAKKLKAAAFEMDAQFGVWRLVTRKENLQIDLTAFQGKNLKEDLLRRDFTFNALAYPVTASLIIEVNKQKDQPARVQLKKLQKKFLVDLKNGAADLKARQIKLSNPRVFKDDPLRMLRAFRHAAELKFTITPSVLKQIKQDAPLIVQSAGERVQEELTRLFRTPRAYENVLLMEKTGLLEAVFPELTPQRTCAECYYGKGGVLKHTLDAFKREEWLLENLQKAFPKYHKKLAAFVGDKALFKMAVLLHDVAKPSTAKVKGDRLRFFYHEQQGARMARQILDRLHYSKADNRLICAMIGEHLRPSNLASNDVITDRGAYKFFRDLGPAAIPMLLLCWADYTSYISDAQLRRILPRSGERMMSLARAQKTANVGKTLRHMQVLSLLFKKYFESPKKINPTKLLDGREIMEILQIGPSPKVGEILEALSVAQVEGNVHDKAGAQQYVRQHFGTKTATKSRA